jgi:hypothetical protein
MFAWCTELGGILCGSGVTAAIVTALFILTPPLTVDATFPPGGFSVELLLADIEVLVLVFDTCVTISELVGAVEPIETIEEPFGLASVLDNEDAVEVNMAEPVVDATVTNELLEAGMVDVLTPDVTTGLPPLRHMKYPQPPRTLPKPGRPITGPMAPPFRPKILSPQPWLGGAGMPGWLGFPPPPPCI